MSARGVMLRVFEIAVHVLGWLLLVLALNSLLALRTEEVIVVDGIEQTAVHTRSLLSNILVSVAVKAVLVYGCALWIFPVYFKRQKIAMGLILVLLLLAAVVCLEYAGYARINAGNGIQAIDAVLTINYWPLEDLSGKIQIRENQFSFWNLSLYILSLATAIALFFVKDWNKQEKQLRELKELHTGTELDLLKLQINPHFLFNTLNNLYSVAQKNEDDETAEGISRLAELMRYQLHESRKSLIPLEQELNYIRSYIELAGMRFAPDELEVLVEVRGSAINRYIPPMLLIPFVENTFKHGVRVGHFSRIIVSLDITDTGLLFSGSNPDHAAANRNDTGHAGIGLENVSRRIALLYPESSGLAYGVQNGVFQFKMNLPL